MKNFAELSMVYTRPTLPISSYDIPSQEEIDKWPHLDGVRIYESQNLSEVDLLIGCDHSFLFEPKEVRKSENNGPYAVKTMLGWVVNGPIGKRISQEKICNFIRSDAQLNQQFEQYCNMEFNDSIDETKVAMSQEDSRAMVIYENSINLVNGHYEVSLPLKIDPPGLPNSRPMAEHRLSLLKKRFKKNPDLFDRYDEIIQRHVSKNYAERVLNDQLSRNDGMLWFLPHHPVFHVKKPGVPRVVFDCSAKYRGICLNDTLLRGPDMTSTLFGVLIRFRQELFAVIGDVEAMFHQVGVIQCQRDLLRFLWWPERDIDVDPSEYRMRVHLFGATSSPSVCNYALRKTAEHHQEDYGDEVIQTVRKNFYVDDCLKSVKSESQAIRLIQDLNELLSKGGFHLTKWLSNSRKVIESVPEAERAATLKYLDFDELPIERALGILWDTEVDCFTFQVNIKEREKSRRGILSVLSSVYDPLGFVAPFILNAKIILQELCKMKLGWDDVVPEEYIKAWNNWMEELPLLSHLEIQRCFKPVGFGDVKSSQLHCFSDASLSGYGAVCYLRLIDKSGRIHTTFIAGKSRVAPLKIMTIPRLELSAATVSIRLNQMIKRELEINVDQSYFWTDSTSVLKYIYNEDKRCNIFGANRIATILDGSTQSQWLYVDSELNPADEASRGVSAKSLHKEVRWLTGPEFLWGPQSEWPDQPEDFRLGNEDPEVKIPKTSLVVTNNVTFMDNLIRRFSSWERLKKCVGWVLRLKKNLRERCRSKHNGNKDGENLSQILSLEELRTAEVEIIKRVQEECFQDEYHVLLTNSKDKAISKSSPIFKLSPIMVDGLIRIGGRLRRCKGSLDVKHQIILPKKNHLTDLIIQHYHEGCAHSGREYCLSLIRRRYWPINGNSAVRSVLGACIKCRRRNAPICEQKMADLPEERVTDNLPPFSYVGIDCFGPFMIKRARSQLKRYGCIFTCMCCRAVHLEVLYSMDTDSFLNAFRRFISRRGCPLKIRTDNGGNFVSADKEIQQSIKEWNKNQVDKFMIQKEIEWSYNPPAGSHFGGIWERCIRHVRKILSFLLTEQTLCDESLLTMFCEVEMIINGRPITRVSDDPQDLEALTPNHLLLLRSGNQYPPGIFCIKDSYVKRRWRHVQYLANVFWRRWIREYLPLLQSRQKWNQDPENLKVDDVVLMIDKDQPRGSWPLARVTKVYPDDQGYVRIVELKTRNNTLLKRPIDKCVLLESV